MKAIVEYINENTDNLYFPNNGEELKNAIKKLKYTEWSKIDTSKITDMSYIFNRYNGKFGDISGWNVSNVKNMQRMFSESNFNQDISTWDVSNVEDMSFMFYHTKMNSDISDWNVSNVKDMGYMFAETPFNQDISKWDVSSVKYMTYMFRYSKFNQDISKWDVSKLQFLDGMFAYSKFNKSLDLWNIKIDNIETAEEVFYHCPLQKNLPKWYKKYLIKTNDND